MNVTKLMSTLGKTFFSGLVAILPIVITLAILYWLGTTAESALGGLIKFLIPNVLYIPGMGLLAGIALVFVMGLLLRAWMFRRLFEWGEQLLNHIPLVKTVYGAVRDLMSFVSESKNKQFNRVVLVSLPGTDMKLVGFVTREDFHGLPAQLGGNGVVAVYLPMSYMIGGYTVMLPQDRLEPLDMSLEDAMRYTVTAGMSVKK